MSGQLLWSNEGAAVNLLLSPLNTKLGVSVEALEPLVVLLLLVLLLLLPAPPAIAGRSNIQGTGTSLPEVLLLADVLGVVELDGVVELVLLLLLLPLSEYEITAKSIRPEFGLRITSLMVPRDSPVEPLTSAPISLLARTSCWPMRPVALRPDWLLLLPL